LTVAICRIVGFCRILDAVKRRAVAAPILALAVIVQVAAAAATPKRLAIYYGYPSLVEGAGGSVSHAVSIFGRYDVIVFGGHLDVGTASRDLEIEEPLAVQIIRRLHLRPQQPVIFGYVDLGRSQQLADAEIVRRVDAWKRLGIDGIFFDEAGRDSHVSRQRRTAAVRAVHERGLSALMSAYNPDDLFDTRNATPAGAPGELGARDALLIESFAVENSVVQPRDAAAKRAAAAIKWRQRTGIKVYAVTTTVPGRFDASAVVYAERLAADVGVDAFGWGEPNFSLDTYLPWRFER
jgi:uncharacterized protein with GYD domain